MTQPYRREDESSGERLDRHWNELLQELRLAQTGTQILFAFLLSIAFQNRFQDADNFTHFVYACTLVASALAVALFLAPISLHRIVYRQGLRDRLVTIADYLLRAGLVFLVAAVCGGLLIALDVVVSRPVAVGVVIAVLAWFIAFWFVIPAYVRQTREPDGV
jgi:amino acid transporter